MAGSTHRPDYQLLLRVLHDVRQRSGITQVELARKLEATQSAISKIERGERRLDVVEFVELCEALRADPGDVLAEYVQRRGKGRYAPT